MPRIDKGHWRFVAVGGLVLLNIVLIALAFHRSAPVAASPAVTTSRVSTAPTVTPSPTPTPAPTPTASASATPTKKPSPQPRSEPAKRQPAERLLVMASGTKGWRASVGTCKKAGVIEGTADGGRTWRTVTSSGLSRLTSLQALDENILVVIGSGRECKANYAISYVSGADWDRRNQQTSSSWYILPRNRSVVRAPGGDRSRPCKADVIALGTTSAARAAVLCDDGSIQATRDAGQSWHKGAVVEGGVTLSGDAGGYLVGSTDGSCAGVKITRLNTSGRVTSPRTAGCARAPAADRSSAVVARSGKTAWLWVGERLMVSRNNARTF